MKAILIGLAVFLGIILVLLGTLLLVGHINSTNYVYDAPEHIDLEANSYGTVTAVGKGLYDAKGDRFDIKGINFGNLFIAEGWMTVNSIGAKMNADGTYEKYNEDGIVEEYEEIFQEEMDAILSRFTDEQLEELNDAYFNSYCTEADFQLIRDLGMNTVRVPMYYRNFLTVHDRYRLSDEELCARDFSTIELDFSKLDRFIQYAKDNGLKVIIDMHGVMGGQSGFEHSGTRDIDFWKNEDYIEFMCNLWRAIAEHYVDDMPQLASTILAYDLVNEPTNRNAIGTGPKQWKVMDRMYDAIREVDTHHVISIEGVWFPVSLPSPDKYGWENVLYQFHYYNWPWQGTSNGLYYAFTFGLSTLVDFDVPKLVGEFTFFDDEGAWIEYLNKYDQHGWGWTIWSYKMISVGYWDNTWGLVVQKLHLYNDDGVLTDGDYTNDNLKLDLRTATYEEILAAWSDQKTAYGSQEGVYTFIDKVDKNGNITYSKTYKVLKEYFAQFEEK